MHPAQNVTLTLHGQLVLTRVTKAEVGVEVKEVGTAEWLGEDICDVVTGVDMINM